ncbi:hypothetical protein F2Q69_00051758 [Brassica cretica]|uniref:Uncharacterized protein n=1 Tax=Brassica cretica TaxID=69181 RepID=A0A8S9PZI0_BRACR|nr:hypothetical protein F2Q69_00051758 [Brassica cretica]
MKKKKPKKASPSKSPNSSRSPTLVTNPPPTDSNPPKIDALDLSLAVTEIVSDAQFAAAELDAQLTRDSPDLAVHRADFSLQKTVIVEQSADPSSVLVSAEIISSELSPVVQSTSSSNSLPAATEVTETIIVTGHSTQLAKADAETVSLSSHQAIVREPHKESDVDAEARDVTGKGKAPPAPVNSPIKEQEAPKDSWCDHARGKRLSKKEYQEKVVESSNQYYPT